MSMYQCILKQVICFEQELHGMPITAQLAKPPSDHKKDKRQPSLGGGNSG